MLSVQNKNTDLKIVPFSSGDIEAVQTWITSAAQLRQWAGPSKFCWPLNKEQMIKYLAQVKKESSEIYIYKVMNADNVQIGHFDFDKIDWKLKSTVLSRVIISSDFKGKGLGQQLVYVLSENDLEVLFVGILKGRLNSLLAFTPISGIT